MHDGNTYAEADGDRSLAVGELRGEPVGDVVGEADAEAVSDGAALVSVGDGDAGGVVLPDAEVELVTLAEPDGPLESATTYSVAAAPVPPTATTAAAAIASFTLAATNAGNVNT